MNFPGFTDLKSFLSRDGFKAFFDWAWALIFEYRYVIAVILGIAIIAFILEKIFELKIVRFLLGLIFLALVIWLLFKIF